MRWFRDLNVQVKLFIAFALATACTAVVGFAALGKMTLIRGSTVEIGQTSLPAIVAVRKLTFDIEHVRLVQYQFVTYANPELRAEHEKVVNELLETIVKDSAGYEKHVVAEGEKANFPIFQKRMAEYAATWPEVRDLARAGKQALAADALLAAKPKMDEARKALVACTEANVEASAASLAKADMDYDSARTIVVGVLAGAIALAVIIALVIGRMIGRPLAETVRVLESVSKGDLSPRVKFEQKDEIGRTGAAVNATLDSIQGALQEISKVLDGVADGDLTLRTAKVQDDDIGRMGQALNRSLVSVHETLNAVRGVADEVASASRQLASASTEISSGAQQQASSLEETAASLEEITSTVKQSSDNAQQAKQLAVTSRESAERGGLVVEKAILAMSEINESSTKIADIITTIDEIAFQTNILALNAAVEAARAGEQGRGFAVVAERVGNLSQRSAAAAKEIKGLINDSVRKVQGGTELVNRSGQSLHEIVSSVKRVTDIVGEMASAFGEQSTGLDQVNSAVTQMDSVTQSNASQTEELSATAESLSSRATELLDLVGRFRLDVGRVAPAARPRRAEAAPFIRKAPASTARRAPFEDRASNGGFDAMEAAMSSAKNGKNGHPPGNGQGTFEEV